MVSSHSPPARTSSPLARARTRRAFVSVASGRRVMGKETKKTLDDLEAERLALEQEAYDDKNRMLKQSQFQELLELQTDEEPEFVEEIVAMFVDDAEAMESPRSRHLRWL